MKNLNLLSISFLLIILISCDPADQTGQDQTITASQLAGNWTCYEKSDLNGNSTFPVKLFVDSLSTGGMIIDNLYHSGVGETVEITISKNSINIPHQEFCDNLFTVYGNGSVINEKSVELIFYVNTGSDLDTVNATLTR